MSKIERFKKRNRILLDAGFTRFSIKEHSSSIVLYTGADWNKNNLFNINKNIKVPFILNKKKVILKVGFLLDF